MAGPAWRERNVTERGKRPGKRKGRKRGNRTYLWAAVVKGVDNKVAFCQQGTNHLHSCPAESRLGPIREGAS